MAYGISQSYGFSLPTKAIDGQKLWVITEYGLPELWVKTELTVHRRQADLAWSESFSLVPRFAVINNLGNSGEGVDSDPPPKQCSSQKGVKRGAPIRSKIH